MATVIGTSRLAVAAMAGRLASRLQLRNVAVVSRTGATLPGETGGETATVTGRMKMTASFQTAAGCFFCTAPLVPNTIPSLPVPCAERRCSCIWAAQLGPL
jgi:hypothetical protein